MSTQKVPTPHDLGLAPSTPNTLGTLNYIIDKMKSQKDLCKTRSIEITHKEVSEHIRGTVDLEGCSGQLNDSGWDVTIYDGRWGCERKIVLTPSRDDGRGLTTKIDGD